MSGRLIILPKKQWHVRNQDNIDRVRKDEAQAAEEARELERRGKLADQEARTRMLRTLANSRKPALIGPQPEEAASTSSSLPVEEEPSNTSEVQDSSGHINFFQEVERGEDKVLTNVEHEEGKKKEQEEYEKKVGYSVALGQDTEELGDREAAWWKGTAGERLLKATPSQLNSTIAPLAQVREKQKDFLDPLNSVRKYLGCEGVRLTMKKHEKKLESEETKAINFESMKNEKKKKRKRSRSRSRSRSRGKKRKRSRSRSRESRHKKKRREKKSKKKRRRSSSSESSSSDEDQEKKSLAKKNLEKLRRERLERERVERQKADRLVFGECEEDKVKKKEEEEKDRRQKYSSQFNPDLAKQNKLDPKRKYWLE